jgi:serine protease Do
MKIGIEKYFLIGCCALWGVMLSERNSSTRDPRCLDGSCNQALENIEIPASIQTDRRSRSFESIEEKSDSKQHESEDISTVIPGPIALRLVQQEMRQQGGQGKGRENRFFSSRAHQIFGENRQLALGAIARADGWIVTKSSEIPEKPIEVRLHDGTKLSGQVKIRKPELDLALIKIDRDGLPAIAWDIDSNVPLGGWIASADSRSLPLALGVVSVEKRNIQSQRALLGIQLSAVHQGPLVENVVVGSGADRAGIRQGDVIIRIEGKEVETRQEVLNFLMTLQAGKKITVDVNRDSKSMSFEAQMMDLTNVMLDPTELEVNGSISARSTGFREVIEHDSVLAPQHCGGPIVDVDGHVVGLNIARAGRVSCYALRSKTVSNAVEEMLQASASNQEPIVVGDKSRSGVIPANAESLKTSPVVNDDPVARDPVGSGLKIESLKPPLRPSPTP